MKKIIVPILTAALLVSSPAIAEAHGNGKVQQAKKTVTLTYSNLNDKYTQNQVRSALTKAGVNKTAIKNFLYSVNEFNNVVKPAKLPAGYHTIKGNTTKYDEFLMQDLWDKKYPIYVGNDCRITAMTLMQDMIMVKHPKKADLNMLSFDISSLNNNPKKLFNSKTQMKFENVFGAIDTKKTKNRSIHAKVVQNYWKDRGISFQNKKNISMISMFFNVNFEKNQLFVGHVGVLMPLNNGKLLFVEKLAFQAPYQAIIFNNRTELYDYLMAMHNKDKDQTIAQPFIMENDKVMKH